MSKICKAEQAQALIIALVNLLEDEGYNLENAYIAVTDTADNSEAMPHKLLKQLVNQSLEYLESTKPEADKFKPAAQTKTTESKEDDPTKPRYI